MINKIIFSFVFLLFLFPFSGFSQFTLEEALNKVKRYVPLAKVQQLANSETDLKLEKIHKQNFPQFALSAQVSYQSAVTTFPLELPGVQIDPLSKDQYQILGEVNQKLYDSGATPQQKELALTANTIENNGVEVELEKIREQIIHLYFGVLELDARLRVVALSKENLLAVLGFGLLVSNFTETQQQAMMISFFFMLILILLSGLFTPIESMPNWAQTLAAINPVTYLVDVMRMVLLKEAHLRDILPHIYTIALEGVVLNTLAVWSYRKQS